MKLQGTIREYPAGDPASGLTVSYKLEADDTELDTDTTDADGRHQYSQNGSPGPIYWESTDTAADPDVVRRGSSNSYGMAGPISLVELVPALRVLGNGVIRGYLDELEATYDAAGLDLDVAAGAAVVNGIPAVFYDATDYSVTATRDATNPRACYLVLEVTGAGESEEGKAELKDVCGTAAPPGSGLLPPTLTQTDALYQFPLASFRLPNTASTTLTNVQDARTYANQRRAVAASTSERLDPTTETTTTSTTGADASGLVASAFLASGVTYDIEARAVLLAKAEAGQTISLAVHINGASNISSYVASDATDYQMLANVHTLEGVVGAGLGTLCGARVKVSGGTGTYTTGYIVAIARPRS